MMRCRVVTLAEGGEEGQREGTSPMLMRTMSKMRMLVGSTGQTRRPA